MISSQKVIDNNCVIQPKRKSTFDSIEAQNYLQIPIKLNQTRIELSRDERVKRNGITFSLDCNLNLCLMNQKDSKCALTSQCN